MCESGEIEDEFHLLFECSAFTGTRNRWLEKQSMCPSRDDFSWKTIFDKPYLLGKFLSDIMKERNNILKSKRRTVMPF